MKTFTFRVTNTQEIEMNVDANTLGEAENKLNDGAFSGENVISEDYDFGDAELINEADAE